MSADKPYFEAEVKDDLSRFFQEAGVLQTLPEKTQRSRGKGRHPDISPVAEGFSKTGAFQRYPNILEPDQIVFQHIKKILKHKITKFSKILLNFSPYFASPKWSLP